MIKPSLSQSTSSTISLSLSLSNSTNTLPHAHSRSRVTSNRSKRARALGLLGAGADSRTVMGMGLGMGAGVFPRDQTTQCIGAALEIRGVLRTVGELLAQEELAALTDGLGDAALECQDKFARLLEAAREEALGLVGRLEEFAHGMGRLVRNDEDPVAISSGPSETRGSLVTVYATATQSSFVEVGTEDQMEELNMALEALEKRAVACTVELEACAKGPLEDILEKIGAMEGYLISSLTTRGSLISRFFNVSMSAKKNFFATPPSLELMEPLVLDHQPFPDGWKLAPFIQDQLRACADFQAYLGSHSAATAAAWELEQKKRELDRWKKEVEAKRAEVKKALLCLSAVGRHFAVLDGKLGEFEDGLAMLVDDVQGLSDRLDGPLSRTVEDFGYGLIL